MFKNKLISILSCSMIASSVIFTACSKKEATQVETPKVIAVDTNNFDMSIKPGDNFFLYSNGGWMKENPIPAEQTRWGSFNILEEENQIKLRSIVEASAEKSGHIGSASQQIGDFYKSGMDTAAINKLGYEPIKPNLEKIAAVTDKTQWLDVFYYLHAETVCPMFGVYGGQDDKNSTMVIANLYQGGLGLGNRDYYLEKDARSEEIRKQYVNFMVKMLNLISVPEADKVSEDIMKFEIELAKISMTNVEQRDPFKVYNKMPISDLKKLCPTIDWDKYFTALDIATPTEINVTSLPFFKGISKIINSTKIETLKNYTTWCILNDAANYLSDQFVNANFDFYGKVMTGQEKMDSLWKRRLRLVSGSLGEALGKLYVEKYFPPEAKTRMVELVGNLRKSLENRIKNLNWMDEATKSKALEKLASVSVKVGYPDKWKDYSQLTITADNFFQNVVNSSKFGFRENLSEIGKPYDKEKWHMSPQTVNAYYSPNSNEIVFPAGILQPPFFYKDGDDAVNYGAIGVVIGHEITHGFDDQGRNFDKDGNLAPWWTEEDAKKFEAKANILGEQYGKYSYPQLAEPNTINPELTMGENIADLGGVYIAYDALQMALTAKPNNEKIDGFTQPQRFFFAYSQVWRGNIRDEALAQRLKNDPHSPGDARVNAILPNVNAWYEAFGITENDKMYLSPDKRAVIW